MLEQKKVYVVNESTLDNVLIEKSEIIEYNESCINEEEQLYLFTWSPDPDEMPDSDFYVQHQVNVDSLREYLACCSCGLVCVESSQMGNPHYHGWYQIDPSKEGARITIVKVLKRFGMLKISEARRYRINSYTEQGNCLYYYKKDVYDSMLPTYPNPITNNTMSTMNVVDLDLIGFFAKDRKKHRDIREKISNREFYRSFYTNTLKEMLIHTNPNPELGI